MGVQRTGGADGALMALMILMLIDYASGMFVALVFKKALKHHQAQQAAMQDLKEYAKIMMLL